MHCWKMTFRDLNIRIWQHLLSHTKNYTEQRKVTLLQHSEANVQILSMEE